MAVETHGVVVTEEEAASDEVAILAEWPRGGAGITKTSSGINTRSLAILRDRAAGRLNALMDKAGIAPENLEEDALEVVRAGIVAYVIGRGLHKLGKHDEAVFYDDEWDEVLSTLKDRWGDLGDAVSPSTQIKSNISTTSPTTPKWRSDKFTGF